ncbi:MAG: flagellar type III secretion system pore protein FliP [Planctomycetota bacterium]|nr:flagellar type III secretion system pore protein FliP [Planctomycetota bacterium]
MKTLAPVILLVLLTAAAAQAATPTTNPSAGGLLPDLRTPEGSGATLKWIVMLTVLSVAPAVLVMVTCFTRIIVVLGLLRQALGTNQLPPNQILFGLALLMSIAVMSPVYTEVHAKAVGPYLDGKMNQSDALAAAAGPVRAFMSGQMENADNADDVRLFLPADQAVRKDLAWADVPTTAMIPGFVVSELKVAFWIGFRIFLPFVIIDMLAASTLISMGMFMVPPSLVSLPFKLLLFVLADGWHLVVGTLLQSFR